MVACDAGRDDTLADTGAFFDTAAGAVGADVSVIDIEIGSKVGPDNRITDETDTFRARDTVHVVVTTSGSSSGTLEARLLSEDGQVVEQQTRSIGAGAMAGMHDTMMADTMAGRMGATGSSVTMFHISKTGGFSPGKYRLQIMLNGSPAGEKKFTVR